MDGKQSLQLLDSQVRTTAEETVAEVEKSFSDYRFGENVGQL